MSQAKLAKGTLLQVETSEGSGVFTTIPECGDITGPSAASGEIDVTSHDTVGLADETLLSTINPGEISTTFRLVPGNALHKQLRNDKWTNQQRNYRVVEPTAEYATYRCAVKTFNRKSPVKGVREVDLVLRVLLIPTYSD